MSDAYGAEMQDYGNLPFSFILSCSLLANSETSPLDVPFEYYAAIPKPIRLQDTDLLLTWQLQDALCRPDLPRTVAFALIRSHEKQERFE